MTKRYAPKTYRKGRRWSLAENYRRALAPHMA